MVACTPAAIDPAAMPVAENPATAKAAGAATKIPAAVTAPTVIPHNNSAMIEKAKNNLLPILNPLLFAVIESSMRTKEMRPNAAAH